MVELLEVVCCPLYSSAFIGCVFTGRVSTRKAFSALHYYIRVAATVKLRVHLAIRKTAVEEIRPWPGREEKN